MTWIADLMLLLVVLAIDRRLSGRAYTPLAIFAVCWLGPLALFHLKLVDYEPMRPAIALAIYGGFFCFWIGYSIVVMAVVGRHAPLSDEALIRRLRPQALTIACVLAAAVGLAATFVQTRAVIGRYGLIGFLANPIEVREEFSLSGWGALFLLNAIVLGLLVLRHRSRRGRVDWLTSILTATALLSLILANQKQAMVKAVMMAAAVATLWEGHVRFRSVAIAVVAMLVFFVGYARVTSPYYHGDHRFYVRDGHIRLPAILAPLGNPYHYLASGYGNLQVLVDDQEYLTDRKQSLRPLRYLWTRLQGSHEIESHHGRYYYAPLLGNTHTYLRPYVGDGGIPLALLASALLGMFVAWLYLEVVCGGKVWMAPAYGVVGWCLFISFFSNHWTYFGTLILLAVALVFGVLVTARPSLEASDGG